MTRRASTPATDARICGWCRGPIPARARRDALYCCQSCRQAAHRFGRGRRIAARADEPMLLAYADPPYPGLSARYYADHPDYAGEVDHRELVERLVDGYPDGWALSTSAAALPMVLRLCPLDVRVAAWVRGPRKVVANYPLVSWEPVILHRGRPQPSRRPGERIDSLVAGVSPRLTDPDRVVGAKPATFIWWLFDLLGALPGDTLDDLFPGSGGIGRAWAIYEASAVATDDGSVSEDLSDASCGDGVDMSPGPDASCVARAAISRAAIAGDASAPPGSHASPGTVVALDASHVDDSSRPDPPDSSCAAAADPSPPPAGATCRASIDTDGSLADPRHASCLQAADPSPVAGAAHIGRAS